MQMKALYGYFLMVVVSHFMLNRLHVTENHGSERAKKPVFSLGWALIHSTIGNFTLALITHPLMAHVSTTV